MSSLLPDGLEPGMLDNLLKILIDVSRSKMGRYVIKQADIR